MHGGVVELRRSEVFSKEASMSTLCFILGTPKRVMPCTCLRRLGIRKRRGCTGLGLGGLKWARARMGIGHAVHLAAEGHLFVK